MKQIFSINDKKYVEEKQKIFLKKVISNALKTCMYSEKIKKYGLKEIKDLKNFPLTFYSDFQDSILLNGENSIYSEEPFITWQSTGTTSKPKTFYNSLEDCEIIGLSCARAFIFNGGQENSSLLNAGAGLPWVSSSLIHFGAKYLKLEETFLEIFNEKKVLNFLKKIEKIKSIDTLAGVPMAALALERIIETTGNKTLKNLLEKTNLAVFGGESPLQYKPELSKILPNAEIIDAYGCSETGILAFQVKEYEGMIPNPDIAIIEIAPLEEILKRKNDLSYIPKTFHMEEWYVGLQGEILITPATNCMPKIRLAIGDIIKVIDKKNIEIKTTYGKIYYETPFIKVLGRSNETIPLENKEKGSFINFLYKSQIVDAINEIGFEKIKWWNSEIYLDHIILNIFSKEYFEEDKLYKALKKQNYLINKSNITLKIMPIENYSIIEKEIKRRKERNLPLGQLKPPQIKFINLKYKEV